jgi:hypothetical protein
MQTLLEQAVGESASETRLIESKKAASLDWRPAPVRAPRARRPELDALRGLFLVWMTLTHLPTRLSAVVN